MPLIKAVELQKVYYNRSFLGKTDKIVAVDNFSLSIYKNEIVGIVGESGSGKSTVARLLINLEKPDKGEIYYKGEDVSRFSKNQLKNFRRKTQYIFQNPFSSFNPRIKIGKSIEEPLVIHGIGDKNRRKDLVIEKMLQAGLKEEHYNRYPHELSGGQCQRAAIARALILDPEFLIADEPTSSLDVSIQAQILNLLKETKKTMIFISHDLSVIRFIATKIVVMKRGKIVESNDNDKFFANPQNEYSKKLLSSVLGAA
jgi:peptide/nickel transport system ATP-binding protein